MIKLSRPFTSKINLKYYDSIEDMPVWNWFKVSETNDLKYLLKEDSILKENDRKLLAVVWDRIYFEFLEVFGVPAKMQQVLSLRREILKLQTKMVCKGRKDLEALIHIKGLELEALQADSNKQELNTVTAFVSKQMGFRVDERKTTVKEFYTYLKMVSNGK